MRAFASLPIAGVLAACGLVLLALGAVKARPFGAGFIALAGMSLVLPRMSQAARQLAGSAIGVATIRRWQRLADVAGRLAWLLLVVAGLALLLCSAFVGTRWPAVLRVFYGLLGALLITSACAPVSRDSTTGSPRLADRGLMRGLLTFAAIAAVVAYWAMVLRLSTNTPFWDDFVANLRFVTDYDAMDPAQRLEKLFRSHWGHRIVTTHLLTFGQRMLFGTVNLYGLALLANAFLFAAIGVIYRSQRSELRRLAPFAPFLMILLQPQYFSVTLWAFSISNLGVLFFAALAFLLLDRGSQVCFWAAAACSIAAAFTFGSGVLVGPLGLLFLLIRGRSRDAAYWSILTTLVTLLFFKGANVEYAEVLSFVGLAEASLGQKIRYVVAFLGTGSVLGLLPGGDGALLPLRDVTGILLLGGFAYIAVRRYWERNWTVFAMCGLVVLSAVAAAETRTYATDHDAISAFSGRYTMNSALLAALLYLALADLHERATKRGLPFIASGAALFCAFSYYVAVPHAVEFIGDIKFPMVAFSNAIHQGVSAEISAPFLDQQLLQRALATNTYRIPERDIAEPFESRVRTVAAGSLIEGSLALRLLSIGENSTSYTFAVAVPDAQGDSAASSPAILLRGNEGTNTMVEVRALAELPSRGDVTRSNTPPGTTHFASVPKDRLPSGILEVALARPSESGAVFMRTPYHVPTLQPWPSSLQPTDSPVLVSTSFDRRMPLPQADPRILPPRRFEPFTDAGQPPYLVELVIMPVGLQRHEGVEVCAFGLAGGSAEPALRLIYRNRHLVLELRQRGGWQPIAKVLGKPMRLLSVGISIERKGVTLAVGEIENPGKVRKAGGSLRAPLPGSGIRIGSGQNALGRPVVEIRELRISRASRRRTD